MSARTLPGCALALLLFAIPASAEAQLAACGITRRICVSAESQNRRLSTADDGSRTRWVFPQLWTPWELVLDPRGALTIRFRGGGANMLGDGTIPPSGDWTQLTYQVTRCEGSVKSQKVVLHVPPAEDIQLLFDSAGLLIQVIDPGAIMPVRWPVFMVTTNRSYDSESQGKEYAWTEARNVTRACSGEPVVAPKAAPRSSPVPAPAPPAATAPRPPAAAPPAFEAARSSPGAADRQITTGEQGGAGGAKEVFFQTLQQERLGCDEGLSEACRAAGIMLRHQGKQAEARQFLRRACAGGSRTACDQLRQK